MAAEKGSGKMLAVTAPSRYKISSRITVDVHRGDNLPAADAAAIVQAGGKVTVRSEQIARDVLGMLGYNFEDINERTLAAQTGRQ